MEMDTGTIPNGNTSQGNESVGESTMISYSVFASLEEVRQAQAELEPAPGAPAEAAPEAGPAADAARGQPGESLQAELSRYTDWLRIFNR